MTLDFKKMIRNMVRQQMSIQHFSCNVQMFKKSELPSKVQTKILGDFGESFLGDADYMLFFSGQNLTKDLARDTLFNIVNSALAKDANNMVPDEMKFFTYDAKAQAPVEEPEAPAEEEPVPDIEDWDSDSANSDAVSDALGESVEAPEQGEKFVFVKITMK